VIRALATADIAPLAGRLATLPLMVRYRRTREAIELDLGAALARSDGLLVWDAGSGADGLCWFQPSGTLGLGGYLKLLAIATGGEGRGAGAALLAGFEAAVATHSRHAFLLVSDFNHGAQRFYQRHGYREVGRLPALVLPDVDELVLWKRLR